MERGLLDRKVLKTYTMERHAVAKQVLDIDKVAAKSAAGHQSETYCRIVEQSRLFTAGFGIAYPPLLTTAGENLNPLVWQDSASDRSLAGAQAPNAKVIKATTGKKTRLFDGLDWLTFYVLVLAHDLTSADTFRQAEQVYEWSQSTSTVNVLGSVKCTIATTTIGESLTTFMASVSSKVGSAELLDHIVIDKLNRAQCHRDYGCAGNELKGPTLVLIRPDGYIGTISHGDDMVAHAQRYLDQLHP